MSLSLVGLRAQVVVHGDVYGGGAFADVGTEGDASKTTTVTILAGRVEGNVYGGALGDATHAPNVYGKINVSIGQNVEGVVSGSASFGTIDAETGVVTHGNVFGGNNANGTPKDSVTIDIWSTAHTTSDQVGSYAADADFAAYLATAEAHQPTSFAIQNLYGGSNVAHYEPAAGKGTRVHIHQCDNTVKVVYGGGRAAAVGSTTTGASARVVVDGGRIDTLFAGGDGHTRDANGDLIPADIYGNVSAHVRGGHYSAVFGASNSSGTITGTRSVTIDRSGPCEEQPERVGALFGGGNLADASGSVSLEVACGTGYFHEVYGGSNLANIGTEAEFQASNPSDVTLTIRGGTYDFVYGGSKGRRADNSNPLNPIAAKAADIWGNVTLNIYGGQIGSAFGGSNINGNILGTVTVNVDWSQSTNCEDGKSLDFVYGGSNLAQYDPATRTITSPVVNLINGTVNYDVFGGGKGSETDVNDGLVTSNTSVNMSGTDFWVKGCIYGGGELATVGHFTRDATTQLPTASTPNTGHAHVAISAGTVGPEAMAMPDFKGHVFGGGKGLVADTTVNPLIPALNYVQSTDVAISGTAFVRGSVYGGSESGHVFDSTCVRVSGGQIGAGAGTYDDATGKYTLLPRYEETAFSRIDFMAATPAGDDPTADPTWDAENSRLKDAPTPVVAGTNDLAECPAWPYDNFGRPYDPVENAMDNADESLRGGRDGHTFYGNVFGGGSGFFPYADNGHSTYVRTAGRVGGHTRVEISGGHILTSAYGGCEITDVLGAARLIMSGGTLGVPRTVEQINAHPVTCYIFGAGKGDQRTRFNTWTFVDGAHVTIRGGWIYGSVFGGGEDGHVSGNVVVDIQNPASPVDNPTSAQAIAGGATWIGTWGTSYVDGNIFGAGRGFGGTAQTAGSVGGNVTVNISGGSMLGSVYGGGRMASVGTVFVDENDPTYGDFNADIADDPNTDANEERTFGEIRVNISGGAIGNNRFRANPVETTWTNHNVSGNVFGGCMGRFDKTNRIWPMLGHNKRSFVTISGTAHVQGNVYGGGEIGRVAEDSRVEVSGGYVSGCVYGGGYGSDNIEQHANVYNNDNPAAGHVAANLAGRVGRDAYVTITGGTVEENVYGGGEIASVGIITDSVKHTEENLDRAFGLSWPYEQTYAEGTGNTYVYIYGGRIGWSGKDRLWGSKEQLDNGDVYGAGKGLAQQRYIESHFSNVNNATVVVDYSHNNPSFVLPTYSDNSEIALPEAVSAPLIAGAVYGGAENGHVVGDASVTLTQGWIGHNIYGGGKGKGTYLQDRIKPLPGEINPETNEAYGDDDFKSAMISSVTAGRVYGNTRVTMTGGHVIRNIYGGGNDGCVGVGNYAGGGSDYSQIGYGELVSGDERGANTDRTINFWSDTAGHGVTYVHIYGGTVGTPAGDKDDLPTGNIFGGCRGNAVPNVDPTLSPRWMYLPEFYLGYVNRTNVVIGNPADATEGPTVYGSVYGGGQDGHVRVAATVTVNKGTIGLEPTDANKTAVGETDLAYFKWARRGNVFGGGSGISQFKDANNELQYSTSAGSVTEYTNVFVNGGTIHQSVYGGGNLGSVGPPRILSTDPMPTRTQSVTTVVVGDGTGSSTATVGTTTGFNAGYGGNVYGSSRGLATNTMFLDSSYASSNFTDVTIQRGAQVRNKVFGGGENGYVRQDAIVKVNGGHVLYNVYGGGQGSPYWFAPGAVKFNSEVQINGGHVDHSVYGGGELASVGTYTAFYTAEDVADASVRALHIVGEPKTCREGTGLATVTIDGGLVGMEDSHGLMPSSDNPVDDDYGYVFCAGRGEVDSITYPKANALAFVANTHLEYKGGLITASAYGGSENGQVLYDTYVKMTGGQIGEGHYKDGTGHHWDAPYTEVQWNAAIAAVKADNNLSGYENPFHECDYWPYGDNGRYYTYDVDAKYVYNNNSDAYELYNATNDEAEYYGETPEFYYQVVHDAETTYVSAEGGSVNASDGHTFYGCLFGGGSGYYPITPGVWRRSAGRVNGNTVVDVQGGHILTSLYGGNEQTDVLGSCTVNMSGGTLGVPRSLADITSHPVTCYLFGAGKGDQRIFFNRWTNVASTQVNITGNAVIFGSVFGGSEDGHVLGNVEVNIGEENAVNQPFIGTIGTSYVDGNIFGGGRGFGGYALTAGAVCGNITINIHGGTMLGSVYGGGRLGSVGLALENTVDENGENNPHYGRLLPYSENYANDAEGQTAYQAAKRDHGYITINITGGTIGTLTPYQYFAGAVPAAMGLNTYDNNKILLHTISGNVFGGCMGRTMFLDGTVNPIWPNLAKARQTTITVSGEAVIRSSVYGGGEMGTIIEDATVNINGGTIGTSVENAGLSFYSSPSTFGVSETPHYHYGSVYGGGYGSEVYSDPGVDLDLIHTPELVDNNASNRLPEVEVAGRVYGNTFVNLNGGKVLENVYGGGDLASVGTPQFASAEYADTHEGVNAGDLLGCVEGTGSCMVTVNNGAVVGPLDYTGMNAYVYAAGKGKGNDPDKNFANYCNFYNTTVTMNGGTVYGSLFGGSADGHVYGNAFVNLHGGTLGTNGITSWDGNIFGGGRNFLQTNDINGRVAGNITINVTGGYMLGTIFGGGRSGQTGIDFWGNIASGETGTVTINVTGGEIGNRDAAVRAACAYSIGDIFGGGKGSTKSGFEDLSARVMRTVVNISDGEVNNVATRPIIWGSVYGGGELSSVGWGNSETGVKEDGTGTTQVDITGGVIHGDVYGGGYNSKVWDATTVNIGNADQAGQPSVGTTVDGSVFGANNAGGNVYGNTNVHIWHTKHTSGDGISTGNGYPVTLKNIHDDGETGPENDILDAQDIKGLSETQATAFASADRFALNAVYGGGNRASHLPTAADGTTLVHVHLCDENTIRDLYGGGNAADTKNNSIIIDGGRIQNVFGGGNGYSATGNHTNSSGADYNPGANVIGTGTASDPTGTATTTIHGGLITNLFGGSNQMGNVGAIVLNIDNDPDDPNPNDDVAVVACEELLLETFGEGNEAEGGGGEVTIGCGAHGVDFYGGANNADITGDIILNVEGGVFTNVFGGSKGTANNPADINGSVTVNFRGGSVENLFGGSDVNGNITGKITVNVDFDTRYTCDGQTLDFVYGAGRNAAYTPTVGTLLSPEVNIMRGRVNYDVFGGGLGATAVVMGNPKVTVGNLPQGVTEESPERSDYRPEVGRNVYGGGNEAAVGVMNDADKKRNTQVWITGFTRILGNVYGGGNHAPVSGNTQVVVK